MKDYIRLTDVLMNYWNEVRRGADIPHEDEIRPENLERIWDDCFLLEVVGNKKFKYDYMGKNLIHAFDDNLTHDDAEELVSVDSHKAFEKFSEVINGKKPVNDTGEFTNKSKMVVKYRQLLLPFGDKDGKVKYILGGMRWKAF